MSLIHRRIAEKVSKHQILAIIIPIIIAVLFWIEVLATWRKFMLCHCQQIGFGSRVAMGYDTELEEEQLV